MTYNIGVSQYSNSLREKETARQIISYGALQDGYNIECTTAEGNINKQIQQIESFISAGVDAVVVSTAQPEKLCGVLDVALERGVAVLLLDNRSPSSRYSVFIQNSSKHTAVIISRLYSNLFDDPNGVVIELMESQDLERSNKIHNSIISTSLRVVSAAVLDDSSRVHAVTDSLLALYPETKLIFAHSNAIATKAKEQCRTTNVKICGKGDNTESVVKAVIDGGLDASVLYPATGTNAMRVIQKIVDGERVEREQSSFPLLIDKYNAKATRRQYRQDRKLYDQLLLLSGEVTDQRRLTFVHMILLLVVVAAAVAVIVVVVTISRRKTRHLQSKMRELLNQQNTNEKLKEEDKVVKGVSSQDQKFIVRLGQIIEENLSDPEFDVEQMSEKLNYSNIQAYRKIKALTGETPSALLRSARVKRGDYLLRNSDKTIADISIEVGFATPSNFSKYYKAIYGELPSKIVR